MRRASTNTRAPFFGPRQPVYPPLRQMVRADAREGAVYSGVVCQYDNNLSLRDREPCYIWEPNGNSLSRAKYRARLIGVYTGLLGTLPLYFVGLACCVGKGSFPSLSSGPGPSPVSSAGPSKAPSSPIVSPVVSPASLAAISSPVVSPASLAAISSPVVSAISGIISSLPPVVSLSSKSPFPSLSSLSSSSLRSISSSRSPGASLTVGCCPNPIANTLHVTVTAQTGTCGITDFVLNANSPFSGEWDGFDNNNHSWTLTCLSGSSCSNFVLAGTGYGGGASGNPQAGCSCDPFQLVFNLTLNSPVGPVCSGTITLTITF
jgi:hypothetical protein